MNIFYMKISQITVMPCQVQSKQISVEQHTHIVTRLLAILPISPPLHSPLNIY